MQDLLIYFKSAALITIVYCTDLIILSFASLSIISPSVREFLIDFKEVISAMVALSALVLTIIKIVKLSKDKSDSKKSDEDK